MFQIYMAQTQVSVSLSRRENHNQSGRSKKWLISCKQRELQELLLDVMGAQRRRAAELVPSLPRKTRPRRTKTAVSAVAEPMR